MPKRVEGIHVLRAVAALMVVTVHLRANVPGAAGWPAWGTAGVDVFFVISGFVMAMTTAGTETGDLPARARAARDFGLKRIVRIIPLYWVALLWATRRTPPDSNLLRDFLFLPHRGAEGLIVPIVPQGWTLNFEMFFYAVFAIGMLFGRPRFLIVGAILAALPFIPQAGFYSDSIVLEFILGIAIFRARAFLPDFGKAAYLSIAILGAALLIAGNGHGPRFVTQGIPAALIVLSSLKLVDRPLKSKTIILLGDASYAIYLFHWASFGALKPLVRLIPGYTVPLALAHLCIAALAGVLIHLSIEKPLTRWAGSLILPSKRRRAPQLEEREIPIAPEGSLVPCQAPVSISSPS